MATKREKAKLVGKAWVIQRIGWEYNDEYYYRGESQGGKALKVYFDKSRAVTDCDLMNKDQVAQVGKYAMTDSEDNIITNYFEVVEVEVA
jgi:hypothetical protein